MRWWLTVLVLAGCSFNVDGLGAIGGAPPPDLAEPAPPTSPPALLDPPAALPDAASTPSDPASMMPAPPTPTSDIGASCDAKSPCASGESCALSVGTSSLPGGYCTLDCTTRPCPADAQCSTTGSPRVCLQECPAQGCRRGYTCCTHGFPAPGVCILPQYCPN